MGKILAGLLGFLLIASVGSHAARAPEQYWKSALPDTPMPSSLSQLLNTPAGGTTVNVGPGGVHVDAGHGKPGGTTVDVGKGGIGVNVNPGSGKPAGKPGYGKPGGTTVGVGKGGVGVNVKPGYGKPGGTTVGVGKGGVGVNVQPGHGKPGGTTVGVGKGGVGVHVNPKKKPVYVPVGPFQYMYAASETQLHDDPNGALFFRERDLRAGTKMTLQFGTTAGAGPRFLPRAEAEAVPFSTEEAPEILARFHVYPDSVQAAEMAQTLRDCEARPVEGERKACATSLESMVHFATSSLGTNHVTAVSTVVAKEGSPRQEYAVTGVKPAAGGGTDSLVACHAEPYPYAVFACHMTRATRAYSVSMRGEDGTAVEAVAVCHTDTAGWNPKHLAFQVLKVKPGTVPVCHFLPQDHVVWTRSD
ncbi:hypothetical protein QOZ80_1AG0032140 [Eleusine coracana subsp. coracana]|nr:hypothetical protein QOZ80_1AG0032140 [Eleusine coracana subsp. coracana]